MGPRLAAGTGVSRSPGARELIELVADPRSFTSWDEPGDRTRWPEAYRRELEEAEVRSGVDESVITGQARIAGIDAVLVVNEFGFLAGSIGRDAARRIGTAIRRATSRGSAPGAGPAIT